MGRRVLARGLGCAVAMALSAAPAQASFHLNRVNEIGLSVGGAQFVETLDPGEPFPDAFGPFKLVVYGAEGTPVGEQTLASSALAGRSTPLLIATQPSVGGQTADITLTAGPLPADGQACFSAGVTTVHCLRWGNVANPVVAGASDAGPAPGDGQSLQRCPTGPAVVAAATPKAANACGGNGGGGGGGSVGGGGGSGGPVADTVKPVASAALVRGQTLGGVLRRGLRVRLRSNEDGRARCQLLLARRLARQLHIPRVAATSAVALRAGVARDVRLGLKRAAKRKLADRASLTATLSIRVTDAAGNARTLRRAVRL